MLSRLQRAFSTAAPRHVARVMDPKFYERDFMSTSIEEIDFIRSPLYDLAVENTMDESQADDFFETLSLKAGMMTDMD